MKASEDDEIKCCACGEKVECDAGGDDGSILTYKGNVLIALCSSCGTAVENAIGF